MTEPGSKLPPPPPPLPKRSSGYHPAVTTYRAKLDSIADGTMTAAQDFDKELATYIASFGIEDEEPPSKP